MADHTQDTASGTRASPSDTLTGPRIATETTSGSGLDKRVLYLMLLRLVLITFVLGATILISWLGDIDLQAPSSIVMFSIIGTTYLLSLVYAVAIRRGINPDRLAEVQLAVDLIITTLLVHATGGAQSAYSFFYPLSIIGAALIRFRSGAVVVAIVSAVLFATVASLGWSELIPVPAGQRILPSDLSRLAFLRALGLNLTAFAAIGGLAYALGGQIQRTAASLETERTAAADLVALHGDIVRSLSSGLITTDTGGNVQTVNDAALEILGTIPKDTIGHRLGEVLPGVEEKIEALAAHKTLRRADLVIPLDDQSSLVLGLSITPLRDNRDQVLGRIVTFQDLTELRRMESEVEQAQRLAAIGTLAAGVAHEIRNPLAAISGSVELLGGNPAVDEDSRALMSIISREIDRLNKLLTELLDYTNPARRVVSEIDLAVLVRETIAVFRQDKSFDSVELEADFATGTSETLLAGDASQIRQVLWNLLRNAAEAASAGGGNVIVRTLHDGGFAVVEVEDDGPGISPEHLERVFDPFFTTKHDGTGLGLATSLSIVHQHRGTIEARSRRGKGSRFILRLPLADGGSENS